MLYLSLRTPAICPEAQYNSTADKLLESLHEKLEVRERGDLLWPEEVHFPHGGGASWYVSQM